MNCVQFFLPLLLTLTVYTRGLSRRFPEFIYRRLSSVATLSAVVNR